QAFARQHVNRESIPIEAIRRHKRTGIAYVYGHADERDADTAKGLTLDEARRIASTLRSYMPRSKGAVRHREILASVNPRSPSIPSKRSMSPFMRHSPCQFDGLGGGVPDEQHVVISVPLWSGTLHCRHHANAASHLLLGRSDGGHGRQGLARDKNRSCQDG